MALLAGPGVSGTSDGAIEVVPEAGATTLTVHATYSFGVAGDYCRVAYYKRGSASPTTAFGNPEPIGEGRVEFTEERTSGSHTFADVPSGDYDVYYYAQTRRGPATEWTNAAIERFGEPAAPIPVTVGAVTPPSSASAFGSFASTGTLINVFPLN